MSATAYSLNELSDATGIEARTIRSYIERGLLPGADARGRGASYSAEHLTRLKVIQALRRARPNIALNDIRLLLQQLKPEEVNSLAGGAISAAVRVMDDRTRLDSDVLDETNADDEVEIPKAFNWDVSAKKLTGAERLVRLLREVSSFTPSVPISRVEGWQRIAVTPDIELSVRAEFDADQLAAFRDLADLLRHLLQHTDALSEKGSE